VIRAVAEARQTRARFGGSSEPIERPPCRIGTAPFLAGVVIHDTDTGRLFQLNRTAAQIWRSLRAGEHEEAIVRDFVRTQGADPAAVRRDLAVFVDALRRAGLFGPGEAVKPRIAATARPPRGAPALDAAYRVGEVTVRVICYPDDVAAAFAPLAAPALAPAGTVAQACLTLFRHRGAFVLTCDDSFVECLDTAPAARWAMVRQLVSAARHRPWLALLHAGAIALPTGCLLLCGDSGAGKSTLLAGLVHAGFGFVADDIVPVEQDTGLAWPLPLAMSIKRDSWPAIGALFPDLARAPIVCFGGRTMRYLWPRADAADTAGYPIAAALFPRYAKGAAVTLTRLDPVRSLALLGEGGSVLPATDAGLADFLALWSSLPAYQLSYERLDEAVQEVRSFIDTRRGSRGGAATGDAASAAFGVEG
jgi:Coenzyme PQQ synthesis protein D (PqqD)